MPESKIIYDIELLYSVKGTAIRKRKQEKFWASIIQPIEIDTIKEFDDDKAIILEYDKALSEFSIGKKTEKMRKQKIYIGHADKLYNYPFNYDDAKMDFFKEINPDIFNIFNAPRTRFKSKSLKEDDLYLALKKIDWQNKEYVINQAISRSKKIIVKDNIMYHECFEPRWIIFIENDRIKLDWANSKKRLEFGLAFPIDKKEEAIETARAISKIIDKKTLIKNNAEAVKVNKNFITNDITLLNKKTSQNIVEKEIDKRRNDAYTQGYLPTADINELISRHRKEASEAKTVDEISFVLKNLNAYNQTNIQNYVDLMKSAEKIGILDMNVFADYACEQELDDLSMDSF